MDRKAIERLLPAFVAVAAGCLYLVTARPFVQGGDSAEFSTLIATGGVAHPPGFPAYVFVLRLLHWIPATSPAHAAALITAVIGAAAVFALARAGLAWGASPAACAVATAAFATSGPAWKLSTRAEVFAPAALFGALILIASAPEGRSRGWRKAAVLGSTAGLALSTHTALVLFAPSGVWAFVSSVRNSGERARCFAAGLAGFALGLLPYAYLYYVARHADPRASWVWGDIHDVRTLAAHFFRLEYGAFQLSASGGPPGAANEWRMLASVARELLGLPIVAAVAGILWFASPARRLKTGFERRAAVIALVATFVVAGPEFASLFNRSADDAGAFFIERFYLISMVPLTLLSALAVDAVLTKGIALAFMPIAPLLVFVAGVSLSAVSFANDSRPTFQNYVTNTLGFLPRNTVILGLGDDRFGSFLYALRALRMRPDVTFVAPRLLFVPWYREQASKQLGIAIAEPRQGRFSVNEFVRQLLASDYRVALAGFVARGLEESVATYPLGPVVIVAPPDAGVPAPGVLEAMNLDVFSHFVFEPAPPDSPRARGAKIQRDYATPWLSLAAAFEDQGDAPRADQCRRRATLLAPWIDVTPPKAR